MGLSVYLDSGHTKRADAVEGFVGDGSRKSFYASCPIKEAYVDGYKITACEISSSVATFFSPPAAGSKIVLVPQNVLDFFIDNAQAVQTTATVYTVSDVDVYVVSENIHTGEIGELEFSIGGGFSDCLLIPSGTNTLSVRYTNFSGVDIKTVVSNRLVFVAGGTFNSAGDLLLSLSIPVGSIGGAEIYVNVI